MNKRINQNRKWKERKKVRIEQKKKERIHEKTNE